MKIARSFSLIVLVPFTLLTAYALWEVGPIGVFAHQYASPGGWQVFVDLVIACLFFVIWMFGNAKKTGRNPWGYLVLTLAAGSFGPLLYFAFAKPESE